ncbi:MAG TPA: alpha/beta hydrolase [Steroidobacteraceae bacterium]|nr:alpha/beta hydrolase [Steroidobacteraceae bacterium]
MRALLYGAAFATLSYGALCALLYLMQDRLLYLRTPEVARAGAGVIRLKCGEATLNIWELHAEQRAAVIYFGGNAEDVGANLADFAAAFTDRALYLVNYRGYGGSSGHPSESALKADAESIYDWVSARHERTAVMGRSLGSGVATELATRRPIERLVLITPYDSIANVAADHFFWLPVRWLVRDRYDSLTRIGKVRSPVLAVVAEYDEVVLRARSDALIAAIPAGIRHVVMIAGATHNDISSFPAYLASLREFLAAAPAP